ncbi:plant UBX domain-containing protein 4-like [Lycium ferocissimum]|uniref:plant UBX domain-containing protein 4-like n=1 Tax=Lycium ferocissimum TaxID=112874 RepID=UPI00281587FD|nr:plant UBX domain-containing protein 4-like [Lycium ferocissimum]
MEKEEANVKATENTQREEGLINTFCEITSCSSKSEALFFLESHNFNLDSAVSTFLENTSLPSPAGNTSVRRESSQSESQSYSPSSSSSSRSQSPPPKQKRKRKPSNNNAYNLRSSRPRNSGPTTESGSDSDEPQHYYTRRQKSGILVQDPSKANDVDAIFNQARQYATVEGPSEHLPSSGSRSFTGTARRLTGEAVSSVPQPPENVTHGITFWRNGFTVDDGPLRRFDDSENAPFLESIRKSECPKELEPAGKTSVHVNLTRSEEDCPVPEKRRASFQGMGRTSGAPAVDSTAVVSSFTAAPAPSAGLVVDQTQPSTSIQVRLADGTRMVSRFNLQHTIRDIRGFIDASRPGGPRRYKLQTVAFPPKELADLDQTIEQAGLANSVVIQKL